MTSNNHPQPDSQALAPVRRVVGRERVPSGAVLLADCSFSMSWGDRADLDAAGVQQIDYSVRVGERRIDRLAHVLAYILTFTRLRALVAFNDFPVELPLAGHVALPEPMGGTALDRALEHVARMGGVGHVVVLSDGMPNSPEAALGVARRLAPCVIDAYYVGPDGNAAALRFMRELAACGGPGGHSGRFDLGQTKLVGETLRLRLTDQRVAR